MTTDFSKGADGQIRNQWIIVSLILAVIGIGLSIYSTMHHLEVKATGQTDAACNINEQFSCDDVALSKFSEIGGVPLGVFGLGYFVASGVLLLIGLNGGKPSREHLHGYVVMVTIGVISSVVLGAISATQIGAYCLTCMGVYALTALQAATLLVWRRDIPGGLTAKTIGSGGTTAVIAVAATVLVYNFSKSYISPPKATNEAIGEDSMPAVAKEAQDIPLSKSAYSGLGEDYRKGGDDAKVVITEFVDFQCPACARISETLDTLQKEYGNKILVVLRNYPLDSSCNDAVKQRIHEHACRAAILARCAGQYGKFWAFHDIAFGRQRDMSVNNLRQWGADIGLTDDQMNQCLDSKDILAKLKDDIALGNQLGVDSTPTLFINGRKVLGGRGVAELKNQIDELLN